MPPRTSLLWSSLGRAFLALALVALGVLHARSAHAADVEGRYRQGPLREEYTVQQWLPGCGPTPTSQSTGGGELVQIKAEGDELAFVGGGRVFRTNGCYDQMPNLARETHSRDPSGKSWQTRCATPANDPRKAILNTRVDVVSDGRVQMSETGRYEIVLESGRCMADIKRTRGYDLIKDEPAGTATATAAPPPPTAKPDPKPKACTDPGEPARLEVRPSKKLLRNGESFEFRPLVLDAKGCATNTTTTWKLAPGAENKGVSVDGKGKVTVAEGAAEGIVELIATAAGKDTRVTVEVTTAAHYDDLLVRGGLNASGETDTAAVVSIGTQAVGAGEGRVEDRSKTRRWIFIGVIGAVLVVLLVLALVFRGRAKQATAIEREQEERHEERVREALERKQRLAEEHAAQLRAHEESIAAANAVKAANEAKRAAKAAKLAAAAANAPPPSVQARGSAPVEERICPSCSREFVDVTTFCPHDGTKLVPKRGAKGGTMMMTASPMGGPPPSKRGKICPTCGDRSEGGADFCAKDGTQLVLLN